MDKRVTRIILAIVLVIVGFAIMAVFNWNVFGLDLPEWAGIPSTIVGIPVAGWGVWRLVLTLRKQK